MAYLGNAPARSFISFERQVFTIVNSQTAYTLDHSVSNENDIRLVINNIVQEPGSGKAYTASGTTLTLSAALVNGTDEMYCVFLGRSTATNAPGAGSVSTSQLASDAVTEAKIADGAVESEHLNNNVISGQTELASEPADTDEFLVSDAGTIKRIDYSLIKGGGKINQVLNHGANVSSNSSSDVEMISLSITPTATSSKVLIMFGVGAQLNSDEYASFDLYRGSLASGTKIMDGAETLFSAANNVRFGYHFSHLDSPSTTSATTYTVVGVPQFSGTIMFGGGGRQTISLMEVLA